MDGLDYATGDIPFIEVTSQLSVFEVRCRKQVAANKESADLTMQKDERGDEEKTPAVKSGARRLAPLAASPFFLPAITTSPTALQPERVLPEHLQTLQVTSGPIIPSKAGMFL